MAGLARLRGQARPAVCLGLPASREGAGSWTRGGGPGAGGGAPPGSSRAGERRPSQMSGLGLGSAERACRGLAAGAGRSGTVWGSGERGWKSRKWGEGRPAETPLWGGTLLLTDFLPHPLTPATSLVLSTTRIQIDITDVPAPGPPRPPCQAGSPGALPPSLLVPFSPFLLESTFFRSLFSRPFSSYSSEPGSSRLTTTDLDPESVSSYSPESRTASPTLHTEEGAWQLYQGPAWVGGVPFDSSWSGGPGTLSVPLHFSGTSS